MLVCRFLANFRILEYRGAPLRFAPVYYGRGRWPETTIATNDPDPLIGNTKATICEPGVFVDNAEGA